LNPNDCALLALRYHPSMETGIRNLHPPYNDFEAHSVFHCLIDNLKLVRG
jgi:hypothetical protein